MRAGLTQGVAGLVVLAVITTAPAAAAMRTTSTSRVVIDVYNTCDFGPGLQKLPDVSYDPGPQSCDVHKVTYHARRKTVARGSKSGQFAVAQVHGRTNSPVKIWMEAVSAPRQIADAVWGSDCERTNSDGTVANRSNGGHFTLRSHQRRLLPFAVKDPDDCSYSADAGIQRGSVYLRLIARVRGKMISDKVIAHRAS